MSKLLEVKDLKKYFKVPNGLLHAVDGVSFSLDEGKTLGVVGESGCGKSTLGRVILGLLDATAGNVLFDGKEITNADKEERFSLRKDMQIIFQDPFSSLNPRMCVRDIIAEPLIIYNVFNSEKEIEARVSQIMDTVGLAQRLSYSYPHELDGGRRQRIGVGRALALDPRFIVCDEPVSALDVSIQAQILNLMQDLQEEKGLTYLFITHDLSVVKHISDDILVMYLGCMVEKSSSPRSLYASAAPVYERTDLGDPGPENQEQGPKDPARRRAHFPDQSTTGMPFRQPLPLRQGKVQQGNASALRGAERPLRRLPLRR